MHLLRTSFRQRLSLRQQIQVAFTAVLVVLTAALAFFADNRILSTAIESRARQNVQDAGFFAALIDYDIDQRLIDMQLRAQNISWLRYHTNHEALNRAIDLMQKAMPQYDWLGFADHQGIVRAGTQRTLLGADVSASLWFGQANLNGYAVLDVQDIELHTGRPRGSDPTQPKRFVDVAAAAKEADGTLIGVLAAHLSFDWLEERLSFYSLHRDKNSRHQPLVIGMDGSFKFGHLRDWAGLSAAQQVELVTQLQRGWAVMTPEGEGVPTLYALAKHPGTRAVSNIDWITILPMRMETVYAEVAPIRATALGGVVLLGLLAWLTLYALLKAAVHPVRDFLDQIRQAHENRQPLDSMPALPVDFKEIHGTVNHFLSDLHQREAELHRALQDLQGSFTDVSATFPGVLFRLEPLPQGGGHFVYLSATAAHYLRVPPGDLPLPIWDFFSRESTVGPSGGLEILLAQIEASAPLELTFNVLGSDGVQRCMRLKGSPRASGGRSRAWQGVMFDISDLKAAEAALAQADRAKSQFLATMSHEIRTPLNGILGYAQLLHDALEPPLLKADAQRIIDTTDTLTCILNDVLDHAKIEEGKVLLEQRPFRVAEVIEACISLFRPLALNHGLDLVVTNCGDCQPSVVGDPTRLKQVLNNLLSNALKFTLHGQVHLQLTCEPSAPGQIRLCIVVRDTGPGMSLDQVSRIFQRFDQTDSSIYRRYGGSGLGLSISKGLVDAMGGTIEVKSKLGEGTEFVVQLTLPQSSGEALHHPVDVLAPLKPYRLLVADDVAMNRELIMRMLRSEGHIIDQAEDGKAAVDMAQLTRYDLIFMDIDMPIMNGLQASRLIRKQSGPCQAVPIIALTGHAFDTDVREARACGINEHLAKPIALKALKLKMRTVLNDVGARRDSDPHKDDEHTALTSRGAPFPDDQAVTPAQAGSRP